MGFLTGGVTALRFKVSGVRPLLFDEEHIDRLHDRAIGTAKVASTDGVDCGWAAGGSILDTQFTLEKQIVNDALHFDLCLVTNVLPGDLLKAYYLAELQALAKDNPSGFASARQKREAKEYARNRLEQEAKDGRFIKRKCIPVMWDRTTNEVLFGATSYTHAERLARLFTATFAANLIETGSTTGALECVTADQRAAAAVGLAGNFRWLSESVSPAPFTPDARGEIAWIADAKSRDFLGNEFLLWLWFYADTESDTVLLEDGSEVTYMFARALELHCPRGQHGADGFKSMIPTRMPEARRAIQAGKLPRKAGLTMIRHGEQYELTLHAETLAISGAKLPAVDDALDARGRLDERVTNLRALLQTIDLLYGHFVRLRLSPSWTIELLDMQQWLAGGAKRDTTGDVLRLARQVLSESAGEMGINVSVEAAKPAA